MAKRKKSAAKKSAESKGQSGVKDISSQLEDIDDVFASAKEKSFSEIPNGKYQVRIDAAVLNNSKASDRFQCSWEMTIISGDFANRKVWKHAGLDNEESMGYFKGDLAHLGMSMPAKASDLPDVLEELLESFAGVTIRTKKGSDMMNVYFDKALDSDEIEDETPEVDEEEAEEAEAEEAEEAAEFAKGDRVTAEIDDETYAGVIKKLKGNSATVLFDDGETEKMDLEDLDFEDSEEGEEAEEAEEAEEGEEDDDEVVTLNFTDEDLKPAHLKKIKRLAKENDFDPDDYDTMVEVLGDIAELCGVEGKFSNPKKALNAIEEAN